MNFHLKDTAKTRPGNFFEDYRIGQVLTHAVPRTVTEGDRALYTALYPTRFALYSSDAFARACGLPQSPIEDLAAFHVVFGKTVPDVSLNAVANLGYAEARFLRPVYPGDTLTATSEVIGLKENSNRKSGVVWVRSTGRNQRGEEVLRYARWVMVRKRDEAAATGPAVVPELAPAIAAADLVVPKGLNFEGYDFALGRRAAPLGRLPGRRAHRPSRPHDGGGGRAHDHHAPLAEHLEGAFRQDGPARRPAARLWRPCHQPCAGAVVQRARQRADGGRDQRGKPRQPLLCRRHDHRLVGGARRAETAAPGVGALRLRTVAVKAGAQVQGLKDEGGKYLPHVLLDLDYWALIPR
jgi:2-methylfumaryl-CoA hydratase